jgi:cell division protein FtsZ
MENIYKKLKDPTFSNNIYSRKGGKNRAKKAIMEIFDKISFGKHDLSKTKNVILNIASGKVEITLDEIGEINDFIQQKIDGTNILMSIQEKNIILNDIEIQMIVTSLEFENDEIDTDQLFDTNIPTIKTLPLYFLEDEYSSNEISEMISFVSDLYQDVGGDELKIRGFQSKIVQINIEPTLF